MIQEIYLWEKIIYLYSWVINDYETVVREPYCIIATAAFVQFLASDLPAI